MKIYIIKACAESQFKDYKKYMAAPPQSIFSLAACTPKDMEIEMIDETVNMNINFHTDADIIAIFMSTPDALRAYEITDKFKNLGKTVILGGLHTKFNQEEALMHGDSILVGECEEIWEELLEDYKNNKLRKIYERKTPFDLANVNPYPTHLIPQSKYRYVWSVLVSRGCVNKCNYCLVNKFFSGIRYRPIPDIVDEIKKSNARIVELHSDNLTADREYAKELFTALIPLKIKWVGEATADFADDDELLELAAKSGLVYLLLGLETPSKTSLKNMAKGFMDTERIKEQIAKLHKYKIMVDSAMLFGFDDHRNDIFLDTLMFVKDIDLDIIHAVIPIPFPGTKLYDDLLKEDRILTQDWSKYDGRHVVFKHPHMTAKEIEDGIAWFENKTYTFKNLFRYYKAIGTIMG